MKPRLKAVLVHGLGSNPGWWSSIAGPLERIGIVPCAPALPSLESEGPEAWCRATVAQLDDTPTILIGHSLGAGVCMDVARAHPVAALILLSCPPFLGDFTPDPPPDTGLSVSAIARVGRFLLAACAKQAPVNTEAIHFAGAADPWVPTKQARRLPFPLETISGVGHGLNRSPRFVLRLVRHILNSNVGRTLLDPGFRLEYQARNLPSPVTDLDLNEVAPQPARLHVELTTRCQLQCRACARTQFQREPVDMSPVLFRMILDGSPWAEDICFVGLGEPLLHPQLPEFIAAAAAQHRQVRLVTNGLCASPEVLAQLRDAGLVEVTFSLDATEEQLFRELRGGAPLALVLEHFRSVPMGLRKSVFATLCADNVAALPGLIDLAAQEGLPAIGVSDLNFAANLTRSLAHNESMHAVLERGIAYARRKGVALVGPHFHDSPDVMKGWRRSQIKKPCDLTHRAVAHTHCLAPWRIAVVGVDGQVAACDCAPETSLGDLSGSNLFDAWNGEPMRSWRRNMLAGACEPCRSCPRY